MWNVKITPPWQLKEVKKKIHNKETLINKFLHLTSFMSFLFE